MSDEARLKRMRMRAWRRGTKEMDLILGPFADAVLAGLDAPLRAQFEALLGENDHDLYQWVSARIGKASGKASGAASGGASGGAGLGPEAYGPLLDRIASHAAGRFTPPPAVIG